MIEKIIPGGVAICGLAIIAYAAYKLHTDKATAPAEPADTSELEKKNQEALRRAAAMRDDFFTTHTGYADPTGAVERYRKRMEARARRAGA